MKKETLKNWFSDGKKPTGQQFSALIDSFIHRDEKIEASQVNGISELTRDFNAEQSRQSEQLNALEVKNNSHQASIDGLKTAVTENSKKQVAGLTITGDVNKVATITLADGSVIQAYFKDIDTQATADVMLNSLNFDISTGVLTGVRSDGQRITVDLDGRFAPLVHTHNMAEIDGLENRLDRKSDIDHAHDERYSQLAHTHNASEIVGLNAIGRNYVINSNVSRQKEIGFISYPLSDDMEDGIYTVQLWYDVSAFNNGGISIGNSIDYIGRHLHLLNFSPELGYYKASFQINKGTSTHIMIYVNSNTTIKRLKVEKGDIATEWSPSYEDSFAADWSLHINNGSEARTNRSWFDYNMMGTGFGGVVASFSGLNKGYRLEIGGMYNNPDGLFYIRTRNGDNNTWNPARELLHSGNIQWYIDNVVKKQSVLNDNTIPIKIENLGKTLIADYNGDITIDLSSVRDGQFRLLKTNRGLVTFTGTRTPNGTSSISLTEANILDIVVHKGISYITTKPIISK